MNVRRSPGTPATPWPRLIVLGLTSMASAGVIAAVAAAIPQPPQPGPPPLAARIDPYVMKVRVVVLTDIANKPDDQMFMVRFPSYSDQFDVPGLNAQTSNR